MTTDYQLFANDRNGIWLLKNASKVLWRTWTDLNNLGGKIGRFNQKLKMDY